jgi:hypothetical protein
MASYVATASSAKEVAGLGGATQVRLRGLSVSPAAPVVGIAATMQNIVAQKTDANGILVLTYLSRVWMRALTRLFAHITRLAFTPSSLIGATHYVPISASA